VKVRDVIEALEGCEDDLTDYFVAHGMPALQKATGGFEVVELRFEDGSRFWLTVEQKENWR
jgi:hypothetical protein